LAYRWQRHVRPRGSLLWAAVRGLDPEGNEFDIN